MTFSASTITAVVGPNGAGKTTLFNVLSGFLVPDGGRVLYGERDISRLSPPETVKLGLCRTFQENRTLPRVSVLDHVLLARPGQLGENPIRALLRWGYLPQERQNRQEALAILARVGLNGRAEDLAGELSYGQQKLLALACCLATGSRAMLIDEPVAGVHQSLFAPILDNLRDLRDEGCTIVFTEHNLDVVREVAEQVIVMSRGRVIACGSPAGVLEQADVLEAYLA